MGWERMAMLKNAFLAFKIHHFQKTLNLWDRPPILV